MKFKKTLCITHQEFFADIQIIFIVVGSTGFTNPWCPPPTHFRNSNLREKEIRAQGRGGASQRFWFEGQISCFLACFQRLEVKRVEVDKKG